MPPHTPGHDEWAKSWDAKLTKAEAELGQARAERDENAWCKSKLIEMRRQRDVAYVMLREAYLILGPGVRPEQRDDLRDCIAELGIKEIGETPMTNEESARREATDKIAAAWRSASNGDRSLLSALDHSHQGTDAILAERDALIDELEQARGDAARWKNAVGNTLAAEAQRDAAYALLRETVPHIKRALDPYKEGWIEEKQDILARIAELVGDK